MDNIINDANNFNKDSSVVTMSDNEERVLVPDEALVRLFEVSSEILPTNKVLHIKLDDNPNLSVYKKMERIVERMQKESWSKKTDIFISISITVVLFSDEAKPAGSKTIIT